MKYNIITFGCKVNQYESNMINETMLKEGFIAANINEADIIIVNTCTVTNTADNKCFKAIRRLKREKKDAIIVVAGCSSQNRQNDYEALDIDILIGNKEKSKIALLIKDYIDNKKRYINFCNDRNTPFEDMEIHDYNHVRAFMKIEDGCDNFCSYCIIPYVRGSVRSKEFNKCISEAKELVKNNHKEIVLTGIHTGRYESNGKNLSDLIKELAKIDGLMRIRISSIEITELNEDFMNILKYCPKVCNHLHIPLQSGSNEILKRMNRKYDLEYFENKIKEIRSIRKDISISTDIIVGFPGETEELFEECYNFAKKIKFSKIHVFPYSIRKGTAAASMPNQIDEKVKKERVNKLIKLSDELEKEYYNSFLKKPVDVLIETLDNEYAYGHTSNYLLVKIPDKLEIGKIYNIKL